MMGKYLSFLFKAKVQTLSVLLFSSSLISIFIPWYSIQILGFTKKINLASSEATTSSDLFIATFSILGVIYSGIVLYKLYFHTLLRDHNLTACMVSVFLGLLNLFITLSAINQDKLGLVNTYVKKENGYYLCLVVSVVIITVNSLKLLVEKDKVALMIKKHRNY